MRAFEGNTADPSTLAEQVANLRDRFGLERVALVGNLGMIAQTRIDQDLKPLGLVWITALRAPTIRKLARQDHIQPSLFDSQDMAAATCPDFPGERQNPRGARELEHRSGRYRTSARSKSSGSPLLPSQPVLKETMSQGSLK